MNLNFPKEYPSIIEFLKPTRQQNIGKFSNSHPASVLVLLADNKRKTTTTVKYANYNYCI